MPFVNNLRAIQAVLEASRVAFLPDVGGGPGIALRLADENAAAVASGRPSNSSAPPDPNASSTPLQQPAQPAGFNADASETEIAAEIWRVLQRHDVSESARDEIQRALERRITAVVRNLGKARGGLR